MDIGSRLINFTSSPLDSSEDELNVQPSIKKQKPAVPSTIEDFFSAIPSRPVPKASAMKPRVTSKASSSGGPSRKGKKAVHSSDDDDSLMLHAAPPPARGAGVSRRPMRAAASSKKVVDLSTEGEEEQPTVEYVDDSD